MFGGEPFGLAAKLLSLACFAVILAINIDVFNHVNRITETPDMTDPLEEAGITVVDSREPGKMAFRSGYLPLARFDELEEQRSVRFTAHVPFSILLKPGEQPPDADMRDLLAKTRANYFAAAECRRLLSVLAKKCVVNTAHARLEDGIVRVEAYLNFIQKAGFGALDAKNKWSFSSAKLELTKDPRNTTLNRSAGDRKALYRTATRHCAEIRKREGNCALSALWIDERPDAKSGGYRLTARAEYGFLAPVD